jgi:hypothetical protein
MSLERWRLHHKMGFAANWRLDRKTGKFADLILALFRSIFAHRNDAAVVKK